LIIAGFGGQGIIFIGELLTLAAAIEEKNVTMLRSYGPAMRGGKANCTVIVSGEEIGSPVVDHPDSLIVMNKPSLEFALKVKPKGLVIINKSLTDYNLERKDLEVIEIEAREIAEKLGNAQVANTVILGAYLERKKTVSFQSVFKALEIMLSEKSREEQIEINKKALKEGAKVVQNKLC